MNAFLSVPTVLIFCRFVQKFLPPFVSALSNPTTTEGNRIELQFFPIFFLNKVKKLIVDFVLFFFS